MADTREYASSGWTWELEFGLVQGTLAWCCLWVMATAASPAPCQSKAGPLIQVTLNGIGHQLGVHNGGGHLWLLVGVSGAYVCVSQVLHVECAIYSTRDGPLKKSQWGRSWLNWISDPMDRPWGRSKLKRGPGSGLPLLSSWKMGLSTSCDKLG